MYLRTVKQEIAKGEDSGRQFKRDVTNGDSLAAEMADFANAEGGSIFLGADDGKIVGLTPVDVRRINQLVSNTESQHIRSPITVHSQNIKVRNDLLIILLEIPRGNRPSLFRPKRSDLGKVRHQQKEDSFQRGTSQDFPKCGPVSCGRIAHQGGYRKP